MSNHGIFDCHNMFKKKIKSLHTGQSVVSQANWYHMTLSVVCLSRQCDLTQSPTRN